jgi:hypothetical protein
MEAQLMWVWGMVAARRRPVQLISVGAVPTALSFFLLLWWCGVGQWQFMSGRHRPHVPPFLF